MTIRAYTLCMDGHWFSGVRCPNDGSESEWSREVNEATERVGGDPLTLDRLIQAGLSSDAARQVLVVEQDLASWPPVRPIEIMELPEDTR